MKDNEYDIPSLTVLDTKITQMTMQTNTYRGSYHVFYQASFQTFNLYLAAAKHVSRSTMMPAFLKMWIFKKKVDRNFKL